jgi:lipopolysaccharide transport system permease protein
MELVARSKLRLEGAWEDHLGYGITREDWQASRVAAASNAGGQAIKSAWARAVPSKELLAVTTGSAIDSTDGAKGASKITTIRPTSGWRAIDWPELTAYRDLFYFLVWRDIKVLYSQTVMGFTWAIIRPVFQMAIFTLVFGRMARVSADGAPYALFSLTGLVPWTYFASALGSSTQSLLTGAALLSKVYFPRLLLPLASTVAKLVDFLVAFPLILLMLAWYRITPSPGVIFLPVLVLIMVLCTAGVGMWLSALAVQYRDVKHATEFVVQILMYAAPVVWPVSLVEEHFGSLARAIYGIYPMAGVIEGFRAAMLGTIPMPWDLIVIGGASAIVLFATGAFFFRRMERRFADVA